MLKKSLVVSIVIVIYASLVFAGDLPAPSILDYQQQTLNGGGVFQANENVQELGNWLEITVSCDYANSGFDPSQYWCLAGASADRYTFVPVTHTFNKQKNWGMDTWRLIAPVTGNLTVYAGTEFICDACVSSGNSDPLNSRNSEPSGKSRKG
jgi:hypothetical protein